MRWRLCCSTAALVAAAVAAAACSDRAPSESAPPSGGAGTPPGAEQRPPAAASGEERAAQSPADAGEVVASVALPTGERATSLLLVEHIIPAPGRIRSGEEFGYRIRLTNLSNSCALENIVVRQHLADGMEVVGSDPAAAGREGPEQVWRLEPLDPGAAAEIKATGVVAAAEAAEIKPRGTCVRVAYSPALCAPVAAGPARAELVRDVPSSWSACELLTVRYRLTNLTDEPLGSVVVREKLTEGLVGGGPGGEVEVRLQAVGPREVREESVVVRAVRPGRYEGRAVAYLADGARIASVATASTAAQASLSIAVDAPEVSHAGDPMRYAVAVTNSGNGVAQGARLQVRTAVGPAGAGPESAAPSAPAAVSPVRILAPAGADVGEGFAVVPLGDIAPGATAYGSFTLASLAPGELLTTVEALAPCAVPAGQERGAVDGSSGSENAARTTVATRLIAASTVTLDLIAEPEPVAAGSEVVYQITLVNQSATADSNLSIAAVIPRGVQVIEATGQTDPRQTRHDEAELGGTAAAEAPGGTILFEPLDRLIPGQRATWYIRALARERGEFRVAVEVTSDGLPRPLTEVERTAVR